MNISLIISIILAFNFISCPGEAASSSSDQGLFAVNMKEVLNGCFQELYDPVFYNRHMNEIDIFTKIFTQKRLQELSEKTQENFCKNGKHFMFFFLLPNPGKMVMQVVKKFFQGNPDAREEFEKILPVKLYGSDKNLPEMVSKLTGSDNELQCMIRISVLISYIIDPTHWTKLSKDKQSEIIQDRFTRSAMHFLGMSMSYATIVELLLLLGYDEARNNFAEVLPIELFEKEIEATDPHFEVKNVHGVLIASIPAWQLCHPEIRSKVLLHGPTGILFPIECAKSSVVDLKLCGLDQFCLSDRISELLCPGYVLTAGTKGFIAYDPKDPFIGIDSSQKLWFYPPLCNENQYDLIPKIPEDGRPLIFSGLNQMLLKDNAVTVNHIKEARFILEIRNHYVNYAEKLELESAAAKHPIKSGALFLKPDTPLGTEVGFTSIIQELVYAINRNQKTMDEITSNDGMITLLRLNLKAEIAEYLSFVIVPFYSKASGKMGLFYHDTSDLLRVLFEAEENPHFLSTASFEEKFNTYRKKWCDNMKLLEAIAAIEEVNPSPESAKIKDKIRKEIVFYRHPDTFELLELGQSS